MPCLHGVHAVRQRSNSTAVTHRKNGKGFVLKSQLSATSTKCLRQSVYKEERCHSITVWEVSVQDRWALSWNHGVRQRNLVTRKQMRMRRRGKLGPHSSLQGGAPGDLRPPSGPHLLKVGLLPTAPSWDASLEHLSLRGTFRTQTLTNSIIRYHRSCKTF